MVKERKDSAIIGDMIRIIIREIGILVFSVSIFPLAFLFLLLRGDISQYGLTLIYRELLIAGTSSVESALLLLSRILAPYMAIQAFRSYQWSKTGAGARKWANLYYALLAGIAGIWFASKSFDLFYFMFQLGDIPGELGQFIELEYIHLLAATAGFYVFGRCLRFFLYPHKTHRPEA